MTRHFSIKPTTKNTLNIRYSRNLFSNSFKFQQNVSERKKIVVIMAFGVIRNIQRKFPVSRIQKFVIRDTRLETLEA